MLTKIFYPSTFALITSIVLASGLFTFSTPAFAQNTPVHLKVGYSEFPPLNVTQPGSIPTGELSDIIFRALDKAGFTYSYQSYPTARLYKNMANGATDLSSGIKGQALYDNNVLFGNKILLFLEERIYTVGDRQIPASLDGLYGKKVGIKRGYGYGGDYGKLTAPDNALFVEQTNSTESSMVMLENGRVDFVLDYKHPVNSILNKSPILDLRYRTIDKFPVYFTMSKLTPNAQAILNALEAQHNPETIALNP